ncbi:hypothetical protein MKW94_017462 [Papaver nudicaule]|uniref:LysM domain-containing protein n=1 Tax=Papaver nudicaule TaxID=74823 RepID=A0AA42AQL6_PAPNU|nr:hypothetical protein [Papaver nudicaule]
MAASPGWCKSRGRRDQATMSKTVSRIVDEVSWWCAIVLVSLILLTAFKEINSISTDENIGHAHDEVRSTTGKGNDISNHFSIGRNGPCEEIYVVGEGETLHTISDKCGDPYIVERNPHIHDPDDVFPGLVIKIISSDRPSMQNTVW